MTRSDQKAAQSLHGIAEIRTYWVETKSSEIDNHRHHYPLLDNGAFICVHVVRRFSKL